MPSLGHNDVRTLLRCDFPDLDVNGEMVNVIFLDLNRNRFTQEPTFSGRPGGITDFGSLFLKFITDSDDRKGDADKPHALL